MRIDVNEYLSACQQILQYCEHQTQDLRILQDNVNKFKTEIEMNFEGKTGDAIGAYIDEVVMPIIIKAEALQVDLVRVMQIMREDMRFNFGEDGIIDVEYLHGEYLQQFHLYGNDISQNTYEVNQVTRSVSDIIDLPRLDETNPQELTRQMRREVDKAVHGLQDTDRKWCQLLAPIDDELNEIKRMLAIINETDASPSTYQPGMAAILFNDNVSPELMALYKDGVLSASDVVKLSAVVTPEVMSPGLWQMLGTGLQQFGSEFVQAFQYFLAPAAGLAIADGPLPIGDLIGLGLLAVGVVVAIAWATYQLATHEKREYKKPKKGSGKEKATDIPSWARGKRPYVDEDGDAFARRLLDEQYGPGNYPTRGGGTEYSKLKKHGDRGYE